MPQLDKVEPVRTAGFVNPNKVNANKRRIQAEEEELNRIMRGEEPENKAEEAEQEVEQKEDKVEAKAPEKEEPEEKLSGEERTYKKRYGDLRKHMNELNDRIKELEANREADTTEFRPPKSDEDIEAWAKKYPDVAGIVEAIAEKKAAEKFRTAEDRLRQIDELNEQAERTKSLNKIREVHADFDDLKESDEFHDWAEKQPKWVQQALYENDDDPASVIRVIDLYKVDNGLDAKARTKATRAAASAVVTKRTTKPDAADIGTRFTESQVAKMSATEYEKNESAILESMRTNKFVYDLSGGAR